MHLKCHGRITGHTQRVCGQDTWTRSWHASIERCIDGSTRQLHPHMRIWPTLWQFKKWMVSAKRRTYGSWRLLIIENQERRHMGKATRPVSSTITYGLCTSNLRAWFFEEQLCAPLLETTYGICIHLCNDLIHSRSWRCRKSKNEHFQITIHTRSRLEQG